MNYRIFFLLQSIVEEKEKGEVEPKPLRFLQKIEKPIPRPPTPTVDIPSEVNKTRHLAICLQLCCIYFPFEVEGL